MSAPSTYTPERADKIFELMANGLSERKIVNLPGMPTRKTMAYWKKTIPGFAEGYDAAKALQLEYWAAQVIDLTDDCADKLTGNAMADGPMVAATRLQVDSRKWILGKLAHHTYGDKVDHNVKVASAVDSMTTEQLVALQASLSAQREPE
jgi:hypothetical protein